jgi:pantothenate kinase
MQPPRPAGPDGRAGAGVTAAPVRFPDLVARARGLVVPGRRALLGVVGSPGAGKSTLVEALLDALRADPPPGCGADWVAHVPMDGYHLADVELERLGLRHAKGAPETFDAGGYVALLARLRAADPADAIVYAPAFERTLEQPLAGAIPVPEAARLVLTEGNYLLLDSGRWPAVRPLLDEVWFCTLDDAVRARRLVARHVTFGKAPDAAAAWVASVDEPNAALIEATRDQADLLVPSAVLESIGSPSPEPA